VIGAGVAAITPVDNRASRREPGQRATGAGAPVRWESQAPWKFSNSSSSTPRSERVRAYKAGQTLWEAGGAEDGDGERRRRDRDRTGTGTRTHRRILAGHTSSMHTA